MNNIDNRAVNSGQRTVESGPSTEIRLPPSALGLIPNPQSLIPNPSFLPARRGVLLLIVLALLAMFAMIGIAFVVLTGHAKRSAKSVERIDRMADPPQKTLQQAVMQILRGPAAVQLSFSGGSAGRKFASGDTVTATGGKSGVIVQSTDDNTATGNATGSIAVNPTGVAFLSGDSITDSTSSKTATVAAVLTPASVIGADSLLETMYGNNYITGHILTVPPGAAGFSQLIEITTDRAADVARCAGCVLTITGNYNTTTSSPDPSVPVPDLGQSTRIVGMSPNTGNPQILAFPDGASLVPTTYTPPGGGASQTVQVTFTINGPPFSGTGFGFNASTGSFDLRYNSATQLTDYSGGANPAPLTNWELALLPNAPENRNPAGGTNSDYTAADFQHMLVAAQAAPVLPATGPVQTLPSLHRGCAQPLLGTTG